MNPNEKIQIGKTQICVTRLGLGGGPLAGYHTDVAEDEAIATVHRALSLGLNLFDTAPMYGCGKSELLIGRALSGRQRETFVLATKVGRVLEPIDPSEAAKLYFGYQNPLHFRPVFDFSYSGVMRSVTESLKRLNLNRIDIAHIHDPDDHYEDAIRSAYPALAGLRKEGAIGAISAGMNQAEMPARFAREADFDCFLIAGRYTLLEYTGMDDLLSLCLKKRISIIIGAPFNSGILATGAREGAFFNYAVAPPSVVEKVRQIESVCAQYGVPLKAAALQFPFAHPAVASIIPGGRSAGEVEENFSLMKFEIPPKFWNELSRRDLLPKGAPLPSQS